MQLMGLPIRPTCLQCTYLDICTFGIVSKDGYGCSMKAVSEQREDHIRQLIKKNKEAEK